MCWRLSQQNVVPRPELMPNSLWLRSLKQAINPTPNSLFTQVDTSPNPGDDTDLLHQLTMRTGMVMKTMAGMVPMTMITMTI
jgi:hypothetical protein